MLIEDVGVKRSEEEAGGRALVGDSDASGITGAGEVTLDHAQRPPWRRTLSLPIEREPQLARSLVHVDGDDRRDDTGQKRDEVACELPEHGARILVARQRLERVDAGRQLEMAPLHRLEEELLLRFDVPQQRGRRHVQLAGNVGERGGLEALLCEDAPRDGQQCGALDRCRAAHL